MLTSYLNVYNCKSKLPKGKIQTIMVTQFLEIERGTLEDVEKTHEMFVAITDSLLASKIDQWNYDYPDPETLKNDVAAGSNFVIRSGDYIAASIVINDIQDEQYQKIHWKSRNKDALVIHRLGVHPKFQGKGLGKKMCLFAEEFGRANGYNHIRLDTYAGNELSNNFYKALGYSRANGYCYFRKKAIPFYCYEKQL